MFTRLRVAVVLQSFDEKNLDLAAIAREYMPVLLVHHPRSGRLSPLDSVAGPAMVHVLLALRYPSAAGGPATGTNMIGKWQ